MPNLVPMPTSYPCFNLINRDRRSGRLEPGAPARCAGGATPRAPWRRRGLADGHLLDVVVDCIIFGIIDKIYNSPRIYLLQMRQSEAADPPLLSFVAAISYNFIAVSGFTISIPTSERYAASLGGGIGAAGLLVGLYPFLSCFSNVALIPVLGPKSGIPMRTVYIGCCLVQIAGWMMYVTAPVTFGLWSVMIGRALCGLGGVRVGVYYIARAYSHDPATRSKKMMTMAKIMAFGYFVGPTLGLIMESVFGGWNSNMNAAFNADTCPGWAMVMLFLMELAFVSAFFEEPPHLAIGQGDAPSRDPKQMHEQHLSLVKQQQDLETEITPLMAKNLDLVVSPTTTDTTDEKEASRNWLISILLTYLLVFITATNRAVWEVVTVFFGTTAWGWNVKDISAFLSLMFLAAALLSCYGLQRVFRTRKIGLAGAFILAASSSIFFLGQSLDVLSFDIPLLYGFGSLVVQISAIIGMANILDQIAHLGKMRPRHNQLVMSLNAVFYSLGRAVGSGIAPYLSLPSILNGQMYALFTASINCIGVLVVLFFMDLFPVPV